MKKDVSLWVGRPIREIVEALGCSRGTASRIRRGRQRFFHPDYHRRKVAYGEKGWEDFDVLHEAAKRGAAQAMNIIARAAGKWPSQVLCIYEFEDLVDWALIRCFELAGEARTKANPAAWLRVVARNEALDKIKTAEFRHERRSRSLEALQETEMADGSIWHREVV